MPEVRGSLRSDGNPASRSLVCLLVLAQLTAAVGGWRPLQAGEDEADLAAKAEQGPFAERNQFLFNLLFLAFPGRGGSLLAPGEHQFLLSQAYVNTFVGSDVFFNRFEPASRSRQTLTPAFLASAQAAMPGKSLFFVDTEEARTELRCRAGITRRFEAGIEVPFLSYRGGAFDGLIEAYHDHAGFSGAGGRDLYARDRTEIALTLAGKSYFADRSPDSFQLGDVSLFGRVRLHHSSRDDLALSAGVKLPTGDPDRLGGSGGLDAGAELGGTQRWGRHRLHYAAGWVRAGRWALFPRFHPAAMGHLLAAYEFTGRGRVSWIAQLQSQTSVFRRLSEGDPELAQPSSEILAGARWSGHDARWGYEAALIENLFHQSNGVDIGIRLGASFRVRRP